MSNPGAASFALEGQSGRTERGGHGQMGRWSANPTGVATSNTKTKEDRTALGGQQTGEGEDQAEGLDVNEALPLRISERLGKLRPAVSRTSNHIQMAQNNEPDLIHVGPQIALLGGGKDAQDDYYILEDDEREVEVTTPALLQDRLITLQANALEAIRALPIQRREDSDYGMVETRVWGLRILRMRLALQGSIQLTRPVTQELDVPQANELLAANLTLNIRAIGAMPIQSSRWVLDGSTP